MSLTQILARTPVHAIEEGIAIMTAIDETVPDGDGVKWFNRLYLRVTVSVGAAVAGATFNDTAFLTTLDVVFANLYFSALGAASTSIGAAGAQRGVDDRAGALGAARSSARARPVL